MTQLEAKVDRLVVELASSEPTTEDDAGTRRARFAVDELAYEGTAEVTVPRPPDPARLDLNLGVRPAVIDLRHSCGLVNADGIRPATVNATTPPMADAHLPSRRTGPRRRSQPRTRPTRAALV